MQLHFSLTDTEVGWVKEILNVLFLPFIGWLIKQSRNKINEIITDNVNRIRDEIKTYVDKKFDEHLLCDNTRFDSIDDSLKELHKK